MKQIRGMKDHTCQDLTDKSNWD